MKLSKAQQKVVDRMQEGQQLTYVKGLFPYVYMDITKRVNMRTFLRLLKLKVIEEQHSNHIYLDYCLTEQYKTQPDSVTGGK